MKSGEKMAHEKITYYRNEKEIVYIYCENCSKSYPLHTHAEHVVAGMVLQGSVRVICRGQRRIYDAGEWFYIEQDTPHAIEPVEDKMYSLLNICIPGSVMLCEREKEDGDAMQLKKLISGTPQGFATRATSIGVFVRLSD